LSRPRARVDICQAACVSEDANIPRRSRARSQFGGRPDDHWGFHDFDRALASVKIEDNGDSCKGEQFVRDRHK
jgi:hypothetical protein